MLEVVQVTNREGEVSGSVYTYLFLLVWKYAGKTAVCTYGYDYKPILGEYNRGDESTANRYTLLYD